MASAASERAGKQFNPPATPPLGLFFSSAVAVRAIRAAGGPDRRSSSGAGGTMPRAEVGGG
eukprot:6198657-Pleurochrysis_carterae.AAC.1